MKITSINLRGTVLQEHDFPKGVTILNGKNGQGKSTIASTPYFVLSGKGLSCRKSTTACEGSFDVSGYTFRRHKENGATTLYFDGKKITEKGLDEVLEQRGLPKSTMESFFNPSTQLCAEDLLKAAKLSLKKDSVIPLMKLDVPEEAELEAYFDSVGVDILTLKDIKRAEKFFTDRRKGLKKEIKTLEARLNENDIDENKLLTEEKSFNAELEKLYERKGRADAVKAMSALITQSEKELNSLKKQEAEIAKLIAMEAETVKKLDETKKDRAKNAEKLRSLDPISVENDLMAKRNELSKEERSLVKVQSDIDHTEKTLDALNNVKSCPLYSGMSCTANKEEAINALAVDLNKMKSAETVLSEKVSSLEIEMKELSAKLNDIKTARTAYISQDEKLYFQGKDTERLLEDIFKAKKRLAEIQDAIKEKETLLNSNKPQDDTEFCGIDEEIANAKKGLSDIAIQRKMILETRSYEKEKANKQLDCDVSDSLVKGLKELPNVIFEKITMPLNKTANEVISKLKPWTVSFDVDGSVKIKVGEQEFSREDLSGGEEVILNYCLKVVVAKLLGLETVIVDDCDRLDKESFAELVKTAQTATVSTVIVTSSDNIPDGVKSITI